MSASLSTEQIKQLMKRIGRNWSQCGVLDAQKELCSLWFGQNANSDQHVHKCRQRLRKYTSSARQNLLSCVSNSPFDASFILLEQSRVYFRDVSALTGEGTQEFLTDIDTLVRNSTSQCPGIIPRTDEIRLYLRTNTSWWRSAFG